MRLLKGLSERRRLRREFNQAQRKIDMLSGAERNTLPWDVAMALYVLLLVVVFTGLGLKLTGIL